MASTLTEARKINAYFGEKAHNSNIQYTCSYNRNSTS